jgi:hypothetical protein
MRNAGQCPEGHAEKHPGPKSDVVQYRSPQRVRDEIRHKEIGADAGELLRIESGIGQDGRGEHGEDLAMEEGKPGTCRHGRAGRPHLPRYTVSRIGIHRCPVRDPTVS